MLKIKRGMFSGGGKAVYKLMLVDDEIWVLRGLLKTIPWEELGFEIVYYTTDSEQAREKIDLLNPDAVITDIKMASLTGLDLLEYASSLDSPPEFILISAYEEFDYAHKALKLGAVDYLIKPLKKSEMIGALNRLKLALEKKLKSRKSEIEKQLFELHAEIEAGEIFDQLQREKAGTRYRVLCCVKRMFDIQTVINLFNGSLGKSIVLIEDSQFIYCIWSISKEQEAGCRTALEESASENMIFLGSSEEMYENDLLYTYICHARCAALQFLIEATEMLACYNAEYRLPKTDNLYHTLQEAFTAGRGDRVLHLLQNLVEFIRKNHYTIQDLIGVGNYICMNLPGTEDAFQKMGIESIPAFLDRYQNIEDYVGDLSVEVQKAFPEIENESVGAEEIRKYVDQHYTDKILVSDIAEHFHMDLNYLGRVFKRKNGKSLKDYLTAKRMEKAMYLLDNTDLKIYEIAEASGYSDYFYFTRVFRKVTGITPTEWREKNQENM